MVSLQTLRDALKLLKDCCEKQNQDVAELCISIIENFIEERQTSCLEQMNRSELVNEIKNNSNKVLSEFSMWLNSQDKPVGALSLALCDVLRTETGSLSAQQLGNCMFGLCWATDYLDAEERDRPNQTAQNSQSRLTRSTNESYAFHPDMVLGVSIYPRAV